MKLILIGILAFLQTNVVQSELLKKPYLFYKIKKEAFCGENKGESYLDFKIEKLVINKNLDEALIESQYRQGDQICLYKVLLNLNQDDQFKLIESLVYNKKGSENCEDRKALLDIHFDQGYYNYIRGTLFHWCPRERCLCAEEKNELLFQLYGIQFNFFLILWGKVR